jgi:tetratricopeptide (TPR) repeat protein
MNEVFGQADPNVFKRAGISLVEALDIAADQIDVKFPDDPELRAALQTRLGEIYASIDEPKKAVQQLEPAVALWQSVAGPLEPRTLKCRSALGNALSRSRRFPEAKQLLTSTLADQTKVLGASHLDTLGTAIYLSYTYMETGDEDNLEHAERTYQTALAALGLRHPTTLEAEYTLSWALRWHGKNDEALEHARVAAAGLRETVGSDDIRAMFASYNYAVCLHGNGQLNEAAAELRSLLEVRKRVLGPAHTDTYWTVFRLAFALNALGQTTESKAIVDDFFSHVEMRRIANNALLLNAFAYFTLRMPHAEMRDIERTLEMATKACELTEYKDANIVDTLAAVYTRIGQRQQARKWSQKVLELRPIGFDVQYNNALRFAWCGDDDGYRRACIAMSQQFETATNEGPIYWVAWSCGLAPGAMDDLSVPLKQAETLVQKYPTNANYLNMLGAVYYRCGRFEDAVTQLNAAAAAAATHVVTSDQMSPAYARFLLAMSHWQLGQLDDARRLLAKAQVLMDEELETSPAWNRRATLELFRREAEALIQSDGADRRAAK